MSLDHFSKMKAENEHIIAVDPQNAPLYGIEKHDAHRAPGVLHRAITVFLTNDQGKYLITRRSAKKKLWPNWWDAACSTHPWWPNEPLIECALRRVPFEIGIDVQNISQWQELFHYEYHAQFSEEWAENEINFIISGKTNAQPAINPDEVSEYRWVSAQEIDEQISRPKNFFAPWFPIAWEKIQK